MTPLQAFWLLLACMAVTFGGGLALLWLGARLGGWRTRRWWRKRQVRQITSVYGMRRGR